MGLANDLHFLAHDAYLLIEIKVAYRRIWKSGSEAPQAHGGEEQAMKPTKPLTKIPSSKHPLAGKPAVLRKGRDRIAITRVLTSFRGE